MPYSALKVIHHPDRLATLRAGGQPAPVQVQLVISDLCNQSCGFCAYRWEGYTSNELFKVIRPDGTADNNPKRFIPLAKVEEILDDCAAMGVKAVQVTGGGEPTVHPDHAKVFHGILSRGLDLAVVTNGVLLRPGVISLLTSANWVRVSIDAGTAETYAATRRVPPSTFGRVLENVRQLCEARGDSGLVVGVGFVVTRENWREVVDATRTARAVGADNIRISAVFQPDGAAYFDDFHADAAALCREAESLAGGRFRVFNNFGERLEDLEQQSPDYDRCGYQHFSTYVGADLRVYRCCVQAYSSRGLVGSLQNQSFRTLWESQSKRDDYAAFDARGCERCMFNAKNRAINYALAKEPMHVNFV